MQNHVFMIIEKAAYIKNVFYFLYYHATESYVCPI